MTNSANLSHKELEELNVWISETPNGRKRMLSAGAVRSLLAHIEWQQKVIEQLMRDREWTVKDGYIYLDETLESHAEMRPELAQHISLSGDLGDR